MNRGRLRPPLRSSRLERTGMPRSDEYRRRQAEAARAAEAAQEDEMGDRSTPEPPGPANAVQSGATEDDALAALDAELEAHLAAGEDLTAPVDSDVPSAEGATQSESNPIDSADTRLVDWFGVSVLGKYRGVIAVVVAFLGVLISAIPLKASLSTSTSVGFVGVGLFLTWAVAVWLARRAD